MDFMYNLFVRAIQHAFILSLASSVAVGGGQVSFRVITNLSQAGFSQPGGTTEGSAGVFYGAGQLGGTGNSGVFSVTTQGATNTLTTFQRRWNIESWLVSGPNGRLYDAVEYSSYPANVFSVTSVPGVQMYSAQNFVPQFTQNLPDSSILAFAIWGSTWYLVKSDLQGNVTSFYQFPSGDRADYVLYASDRNYYGVAQSTGSSGSGYVYRVTPSGSVTKLYTFPNHSFLGNDFTPLLQASDGALYGALPYAGSNGTGIIYKLTLAGQYTQLYTFPASAPAGYPDWLIQASDGNLYGATLGNLAGPTGHSVLFRITRSGQYSELYAWSASACQCYLTQGSDGLIYGIGNYSDEFFALDAGLPKPRPRVQQLNPTSGAVGTQVLIWGSNFLSATAVKFNGVPAAAFSSSGANYITATVPAGATTGPITVTTPNGTYTTKQNFTVK